MFSRAIEMTVFDFLAVFGGFSFGRVPLHSVSMVSSLHQTLVKTLANNLVQHMAKIVVNMLQKIVQRK